MDPTTAAQNIIDRLHAGEESERQELIEALDALMGWLLRDGFLPDRDKLRWPIELF